MGGGGGGGRWGREGGAGDGEGFVLSMCLFGHLTEQLCFSFLF